MCAHKHSNEDKQAGSLRAAAGLSRLLRGPLSLLKDALANNSKQPLGDAKGRYEECRT